MRIITHALFYIAATCPLMLSCSTMPQCTIKGTVISDLLNQERMQQHTVNAEYIEDRYSLVMGRYAMFSLKWSFGKMNPAKNARVQNAMYNML